MEFLRLPESGRWRIGRAAAIGGLLLLRVLPARGALVINEVLYDPAGPDNGFEWVELHNSGPWPATLEGVGLEAGDGSGPGRWTKVWAGKAGQWIESGGFFWVGGSYQGRHPDSLSSLGLQNGPDGVRLMREGLELDRLGWGEHSFTDYYEALSAATVGSGRSLARRSDGVDGDNNAADFEEAWPTPGRSNHPKIDLAVGLARSGRALPVPTAHGAVSAWLSLRNLGTEPLDPAAIQITVDGQSFDLDFESTGGLLASGTELRSPVLLPLRGLEGDQSWVCVGRVLGDPVPENDSDTLRLWVGAPPVRFSEISPRPDSAGTEWVELHSDGSETIDLAGWSVRDCSDKGLTFDSTGTIESGTFPVLARDRQVLLNQWADLPETDPPRTMLSWVGAWPPLNDAAREGEAADTLFLISSQGRIVDWAAFGEVERGHTWIRLPGPAGGLSEWAVSPGPPGGTPGRSNPKWSGAVPVSPGAEEIAGGFTARQDPAGVWFHLPADLFPGRWTIRVCNLEAQSVWTGFGDVTDRVEHWVRWDGRGPTGGVCTPGVYLVQLALRADDGRERITHRSLVCGR